MSRNLFLFFFVLFCSAAFSQLVHPGFADGRIYVKFSPEALRPVAKLDPHHISPEKLKSLSGLTARYGITKLSIPFYQANDDARLPYVIKVHFAKAAAVDQLIDDLRQVKGVEYAEKIPLAVTHATPNDFSLLSASPHLTLINAPQAWNVFNGNSNITVAIVDNAVKWTHADLIANTYTNTAEIAGNGIDDDNNGYIDDRNGWNVSDNNNNAEPTSLGMLHGTHVAGIAGARTDNNTGVASIGWNIKIIPVQCEPDAGSNSAISNGYEGIIYAAKAKARIINCSWGNSFGSSMTEQAVIDYAWNKGCIIIASAGNSNSTSQNWPGAYNNVYCVAAVDNSDAKWFLSNYGSYVDIAAPGYDIMSTIPYASTPAYSQSSGTSMSAPVVSGLAALMLSKSPNMTRQDVLNCISSTAVNIGTLSANSSYSTGLGAGRIDAFAAMNCAATFSAMPPVANFYASDRVTCPNTPVVFTDSSLYMPTAWSWTFQGGSPATSTSSNPVVQYSTTGTYPVTLTVSNASGSSSKIKTGYISVTGTVPLPLVEGFQGSQFLPADWTAKNILNDVIYWERATGVGGFGTSTACAMFDNYNFITAGEREEMRTPKYNLGNAVSAKLVFDVAYARYDASYSDTLEVKLSTNCGVTWTQIYSKGGSTLATAPDYTAGQFTPSSSQWRRDSVDVSVLTAGQGNVMFSFVNRGGYGQPIYLDNINLYFPSPVLNAVYPATVCAGQTVSYTNTSTGSSSYTWNIGGSVSNGTHAAVIYSLAGSYTGTLTGLNGTAVSTKTLPITVIAIPTLAVNNPTICSGSSATLTGSGASTYSWSAGPATASMVVSPTSTSVYTLTGTNGGLCSSSRTAAVNVIVTPTIAVNNHTVCPGGSATLTASGAGSYSWSGGATGASISITPTASTAYTVTGYNSNCSDTRTLSVMLTAPLPLTISVSRPGTCPGAQATLVASGATTYTWSHGPLTASTLVSPSTTITYTLKGAAGSCTGSASSSLQVDPQPTLSLSFLPSLPICAGTQVTLTANGAPVYSWSTGQSTQTITVLPSINSTYTVYGTNGGCTTSSSINIPVSNGITLALSSSSGSVCAGSTVTLTASGAATYTWSSGGSGTVQVLSPSASSTVSVSGTTGGCTGTASVNIAVVPVPVSALTVKGSACKTGCSGFADAISSGGSAPFTYTVSGTACTALPCKDLCPGSYTLTSANAEGCKSSKTFSVASLPVLAAAVSSTPVSCASCNDGQATIMASGGIPPFTYSWTPSVSSQSAAASLAQGCYTVQVKDDAGCVETTSVCVLFATGLTSQENTWNFLVFPNPGSGNVQVICEGRFSLNLYSSTGQLVLIADNQTDAATIRVAHLAKGIYYLELRGDKGNARKKLIIE